MLRSPPTIAGPPGSRASTARSSTSICSARCAGSLRFSRWVEATWTRDPSMATRGDHGHAPAHPGLGRVGGEPPGAGVGQAHHRRVRERRRRHDGVAVQAPLVAGAGGLALLRLVAQPELHELHAVHVARPEVGAMAAATSSFCVRAMPESSSESRQCRRPIRPAAPPALDGRRPRWTFQATTRTQPDSPPAAGPACRRSTSRRQASVAQQPALQLAVSEPARPAGPFGGSRRVHAPSLSPVPSAVRRLGGRCDTPFRSVQP